MTEALLQIPRPRNFPVGKPDFPVMTRDTSLESLVGPKSWLLFELLGARSDWLALPPHEWYQDQGYFNMAQVVRQLAVVNDAAERCFKDIQEYANAAQDGQHRENIMLVSGSHRIKVPGFLKNEMEEHF